eukprot:362589-Chlamydomonas_euryale.AAC.6
MGGRAPRPCFPYLLPLAGTKPPTYAPCAALRPPLPPSRPQLFARSHPNATSRRGRPTTREQQRTGRWGAAPSVRGGGDDGARSSPAWYHSRGMEARTGGSRATGQPGWVGLRHERRWAARGTARRTVRRRQ